MRKAGKRSGFTAPVLAAALLAAGVPSAGLALGALGSHVGELNDERIASFTPASVDPEVAQFVAERSSGQGRLMRITPATISDRPNRSVTVAVRVDQETAQAISVRSAIAAAQEQVAGDAGVRIAPTRYNLGMARGYQSFAQAPVLSKKLSGVEMPDLASFKPSPGVKSDDSRFAAKIELQEERALGSAPRTREALPDQALDVAGSYRLTRNLDVTAGVRYSQERDRMAPIADPAQLDSQAVYVGTQFRF